jgi:hypothetical protein
MARVAKVGPTPCFSASSRRGDLKKSMTNIASECRSANIARDHAMILPDEATPKPDGIFGKHTSKGLDTHNDKQAN